MTGFKLHTSSSGNDALPTEPQPIPNVIFYIVFKLKGKGNG